jgi:hypothetical protein
MSHLGKISFKYQVLMRGRVARSFRGSKPTLILLRSENHPHTSEVQRCNADNILIDELSIF